MERADAGTRDCRSSRAAMEDWRRVSRNVARNALAYLLDFRRTDRDVDRSIETGRSHFSNHSTALFTFGYANFWKAKSISPTERSCSNLVAFDFLDGRIRGCESGFRLS